jgi:GT2 family glycosyltransferase/glycosyltransferase involved in cell wall biosynthesis
MAVDVLLAPMSSGNRLRIVGFLGALRRLGWRIGLVTVRDTAPLEQLRELVDEVSFVPARRFSGGPLASFDARPFRVAVTELAAKRQPAVVIAQYAWLGPALAELDPGVQRWIDCHDILHERTARFAAAGLDPWARCSWAEERERLTFADLLICCQERDRDRLGALLPQKHVVSIMTPVDVPVDFAPQPGSGSTVLTVGALHDGNLAVPDFAAGAWDRVLERVPGAKLRVVGGISATVAARSSVDVLGTVDRLDEHYADAAVVVCPVTAGSGVKTKMLEALRYGKAVVTTELGAEGMPECSPPAWATTPSLEACADVVADLLIDGTARAAFERAAFTFAERTVSGSAFQDQIDRLLPDGLPAMTVLVPEAPAVSVIVTNVASWRDLRACLQTLCAQRYPPFQVEIIVAVASYGAPLWAAVARHFSHVTVLVTGTVDTAGQRRAGAQRAQGEFVAFIDADCRAGADWLRRAVLLCEKSERRAIVAENVQPSVPPGAGGFAWYDAVIEDERTPGEAFLAERRWWNARASVDEDVRLDGAGVVRPNDSCVMRTVATGPRTFEARARRRATRASRPLIAELVTVLTDPRVPNRARAATMLAALRAGNRHPATDAAQRAHTEPPGAGVERRCDSISVIIPCFGRPDSLAACLQSVREQKLDVPFEIILVFNGPLPSDHGDHEWPGVRVVHEPKAGPAAARNAGVAVATGDVFAFIDADCIATPNWLDAALSALRNGGSHRVIAGAIARPPARANWIAHYDRLTYLRQRDYVAAGGCVTANLILHRDIFRLVGVFDTHFSEAAYEDWDWATRARTLGVPLAFAKDAVVVHPCMQTAAELKRKAERLARGNLLMQRKLGQPIVVEPIGVALGRSLTRAVRDPRASVVQRLSLLYIGARVAVWSRRAAREERRRLNE